MKNCRCIGSLCRSLLFLLTAATGAFAQNSTRSSIVGTVRDTSGMPVTQTRLTSNGFLTMSDSVGRFTLTGLAPGATIVFVRRLGFEPLDISFDLVSGTTHALNVVLTVLPQDLPGLTTTAQTLADIRLRDFYRHRQSGIGYFLDRQEIERKNAQRISDILRRVPGTRMMQDRSGRAVMRSGRSGGGRDCPPDVWLDGVRAAGMNVDDVPLGDVEALELYRGPAGLPPEMNNRFGNPGCGALIIWTRLPG